MSTAITSPRTAVRWHISFLLFCIVVLTFLDRMKVSVAARYIQLEFGFNNSRIGFVPSAYVVGYALFQIPGGLLGGRFGPRKLLAFAVAWWSVFAGLGRRSGLGPIGGFFATRILAGVGEAAAIPNCNKTVAQWMAPSGRGIGNSLFLAGIGSGGAISPPLIAVPMPHLGWRWPFAIRGILDVAQAGLAAGPLSLALTNWWATVNDIGPGDSGTLSGIMNTAGSLGGVVSPVMTPWIAGRFGWTRALDFAALVVVSAGALWLPIRNGSRESRAEERGA
jgi:ACS family glucarate transporter-like MFS transporter